MTELAELVGDSLKWRVAPTPTVSASDVGGGFPSGSGLYMIDRGNEAKLIAAYLAGADPSMGGIGHLSYFGKFIN